MPSVPSSPPYRLLAAIFTLALLTTGCDPVVNVYGSFFPAWVVCLAGGITATVALRWVFALTRLERNLGPLTLVYPALAFLLSGVIWLKFFGP